MKTITDYHEAAEEFVATLKKSPYVAAAYLYGSLARGEIVPGLSDIDFWVFIKDEAFTSKNTFIEMMESLIQAGERLASKGLPDYHAFCYYELSEARNLPAGLVPNLQSDASSRLMFGDNVREQMGSSAASFFAHKMSYFADMRRHVFLPLTPYLGLKTEAIDEKAERYILGGLKYVKYTAEAACAALSVYPGELGAIDRLKELLPEVETAVIREVEAFRVNYKPERERHQLIPMLAKALDFVESVHIQLRKTQ